MGCERLRFRFELVLVWVLMLVLSGLDGLFPVAIVDCSFFQLLETFLRSISAYWEVFAGIELLFLMLGKKSGEAPQAFNEAQRFIFCLRQQVRIAVLCQRAASI